jgi:hypothetical protein
MGIRIGNTGRAAKFPARLLLVGFAASVAMLFVTSASAQAASAWQAPGTPDSRYHCGPYTVGLNDLKAQDCVIVMPTPSGAYVQSLLAVSNVSSTARVLTGFTYSYLGNMHDGPQLSYTDCLDVTIPAHERRWCFSATKFVLGHGRDVAGRGWVHNYHYGQYQYVDSPTWKT